MYFLTTYACKTHQCTSTHTINTMHVKGYRFKLNDSSVSSWSALTRFYVLSVWMMLLTVEGAINTYIRHSCQTPGNSAKRCYIPCVL